MKVIENLLREKMGLHAQTIGTSAVERTVRSRMRANGATHESAYLKLLGQSPAEWAELVESLVVTETWFFRDKAPFQALVRLATEEWLPAHPTGILRLLSVPCSSGEEPHSMAMALIDAGFPPERFQIDAFDISERALAYAQYAQYGKNSFRGHDLRFQNRHFERTKQGYLLSPSVRKQTRFQKGNLLDPGCLNLRGVYDFVFCRNLLIYFDQPTQEQSIQKLRQLMTASGVLFVGAAELPVALANGFRSTNLPFSFTCRKGDETAKAKQLEKPPQEAANVSGAARSAMVECEFSLRSTGNQESSAVLEQARLLAESGRLAEAEALCEKHLRERGVSAEAYYLLGLIRHAAGANTQAGELYRKALYLEPNHYNTMIQWAQLSKNNGDDAHARLLQERAERARRLE